MKTRMMMLRAKRSRHFSVVLQQTRRSTTRRSRLASHEFTEFFLLRVSWTERVDTWGSRRSNQGVWDIGKNGFGHDTLFWDGGRFTTATAPLLNL